MEMKTKKIDFNKKVTAFEAAGVQSSNATIELIGLQETRCFPPWRNYFGQIKEARKNQNVDD